MNSSAIISKLEAEGWTEVRVRGSHHYFRVEDDGVCSAPQKRSADRYREKYRKASRDTLQVMLSWGGVL